MLIFLVGEFMEGLLNVFILHIIDMQFAIALCEVLHLSQDHFMHNVAEWISSIWLIYLQWVVLI